MRVGIDIWYLFFWMDRKCITDVLVGSKNNLFVIKKKTEAIDGPDI